MKKSTRITLYVVGILIGLVVLFLTCADVWVSRYAEKRVRAELAKAELPYTIDFKHIHVLILGHFVSVDGVLFEANKAALKAAGLDTLHVEIPRVSVSGVSYMKLLRDKIDFCHIVSFYQLLSVYPPHQSLFTLSHTRITKQPELIVHEDILLVRPSLI